MKINVVMGGPSAEYEISIRSGYQVLSHLVGHTDITLRVVVVSRDLRFYFADIVDTVPSEEILAAPEKATIFEGPYTPQAAHSVWDGCNCAFLAVHGSFGEDGRLQGYLDTLGIPYTGSDVFASAVAMNKIASKALYAHHGIPTPASCVVRPHQQSDTIDAIITKLGLPLFVKCPQSGSSKLMGRASTKEELHDLITELSRHADEILVEQSIHGPEFTCPVLERPDGTVTALEPIEIRPLNASAFFDYTAKYASGASEELVPAPRPKELLSRIQQTALAVHRITGCRGVSRTDMMYANDTLYVLETNTLPGLTTASLLPKSFAVTGGTYTELLEILIGTALARQA